MGGAASQVGGMPYMGQTEAELVNLMMPVYFLRDEDVTKDDLATAKSTWNMILDDTAPGFHALKGTPGFEHSSSMMMFYDTFYSRLFDVHPLSRPLFKSGLKSQGKFLVKMIGLALGLINDPVKFQITLVKLTETHNERGIKAIEYGIVGEVLCYTLRQCVGSAYTPHAHFAWVKILSKILAVMVPVAVTFEIHSGGENQKLRLQAEQEKSKAPSSSKASGESDSEVFEKKYGLGQ